MRTILNKNIRLNQIKSFGNSMFPILQDGDIVYIKKINFRAIKINDIVIVKKNNIFFTHRVVYIERRYIITKGDRNLLSDGKISSKQIYGIVKKVKRNGEIIDIDSLYLYQSSLYLNEIILITKEFKKNNIPFVFLKGLPYYLCIFKKYPKRFFSDCDILIQMENAKKADIALRKLGYLPEKKPHTNQFKFLDKSFNEKNYYKFTSNKFPIIIDMHTNITLSTSKAYLPIEIIQSKQQRLVELFFSNIDFFPLQKEKIPLLKHEYFVIYLALHLFKENFSLSHNLNFIYTVVKKIHINWNCVIHICREEKIQNFVIPTFYLLHKYYHFSYPYLYFRKISKNEVRYSINVFNKIYGEDNLFDDRYSSIIRFKKAASIFLFTDESIIKKIYQFMNINIILHAIYISLYKWKRNENSHELSSH